MSFGISLNEYDENGDLSNEGIYLHFGDTRIKVGESIEDFDAFIFKLKSVRKEIEENLLK